MTGPQLLNRPANIANTGGLFKNYPKYNSLGDYLNEKRFLLACRLLREEPHWTIEAVGAEAGFGGRRTFQTEVKPYFAIEIMLNSNNLAVLLRKNSNFASKILQSDMQKKIL